MTDEEKQWFQEQIQGIEKTIDHKLFDPNGMQNELLERIERIQNVLFKKMRDMHGDLLRLRETDPEPDETMQKLAIASGRVSTQMRSSLRSEMLIARSRIRSIRCCRTPSGRLSQLRAGCPSVRAAALAAEDHSAEFIAQAVSRFRILLVAETLGEGKKLLLLSLLCVDSFFDQLQQHAIFAQFSALGQAPHLLCHPGRQANALANRLLSHLQRTAEL